MNPFIAELKARGYLEAGDAWARLALDAADRARACWQRAGLSIADAETAFRALVARVEQERATESADGDVWVEIAKRLEQENAA